MSAVGVSRLTVRDLLALALYDRFHIVAGAAIPFLLGLIAAVAAPSWYESDATLLVLRGAEYLPKSPVNPGASGPGLDPSQILSAEAELVDNPDLLRRVVEQVGADKIYPGLDRGDIDKAATRLELDLAVDPVFAAGVLHLGLRNRNADAAQMVLGRIMQTYLKSRIAAVASQMTAPMAGQADQMAARLREAENALHRFTADHGISDIAAQRDHLLRLRSDLLANQREAEALVPARQAELAAARQQLASIPGSLRALDSSGRLHELENAKASLLTLELRRKDVATRTSEDSEEVRNLDLQIATVRAFIASEPARIQDASHDAHNPAYDEARRRVATLEAEIKGLDARAAAAAKNVTTVSEQLSILDGFAPTYDRLAEAEHAAEESLLAYVPKVEELKIDDQLAQRQSSNVRIVENATMPTRRHGRGGLYLAIGVFVSLIGGLGATFLRTSLRQVCVLPGEMEKWMGLPSLLVVDYREPEGAQ